MTKFKTLLFTIAALVITTYSCNKNNEDSVKIQAQNLEKKINEDLKNKTYYDRVYNKYMYTAKNLDKILKRYPNTFIEKKSDIKKNYKTASIPTTLDEFFLLYSEYGEGVGYSVSEMQNIQNQISSLNITTENMYQYFHQTGEINLIEKNILQDYFNDLIDPTISNSEFLNITSVIEFNVSISNLSEAAKNNILTTTDAFSYFRQIVFTDPNFTFLNEGIPSEYVNGSPNEDVACGGTMVVMIAAGAITGNGPGAVVGMFTGLWSCYVMGCMEYSAATYEN